MFAHYCNFLHIYCTKFSKKMHSLIKAADDFEQKTSEETFDEKTFVEFMKKVAI